jgi:hypothetical protein
LLIDRIARFAWTPRAPALVAVWALAEAIFLPIVPDVALLMLTMAAPRRGSMLFASLVAGSLVGTAALWLMVSADPPAAERLIMSVPGIRPQMLSEAIAVFAAGSPLPFALVGPGTPLKVLSLAWLQAGGWAPALAVWVVVNRLTRIGPLLLAFALGGALAPQWLRRHERLVLASYGTFWLAVYVLYLA